MSKRIALVTGGIGGIGTAICRQLAKDGCTVVANHIAQEALPVLLQLAGPEELAKIRLC